MSTAEKFVKRIKLKSSIVWTCALILPFITSVLVQIPLQDTFKADHFFNNFSPLIKKIIIIFIVFLPSFILFAFMDSSVRQRLSSLGLFILLMPGFIMLVAVYSLFTACMFFGGCL
jgi:hypothetical protein